MYEFFKVERTTPRPPGAPINIQLIEQYVTASRNMHRFERGDTSEERWHWVRQLLIADEAMTARERDLAGLVAVEGNAEEGADPLGGRGGERYIH
ncbi:hypothetical protein [Bradyrhizobium oligotrophicum]|uniref:hypothetical protein n=1 Tax=Bradyrhizobium oligotrophicum TaxID=44255 RepID=UPI003EC0AE9E